MQEFNNDTICNTGDFDVDGSGSFGESLLVVGNFDVQGVLSGDGSGLTNLPTAVSASHALQADSASHALTASFVEGVSAGARTGSYTGTFVGSASHAENADTAVLAVSAVTALTASLANVAESGTGSFTGSFIGTFDGKVPSESRVYHELVDDGIFSASFTMSFENTNFRKMRASANVDVSFTGLAVGQVCVLEIDNTDDHIVILTDPENIWSESIVPNTPTGPSILTIVEITVGTALSFPFTAVKYMPFTDNLTRRQNLIRIFGEFILLLAALVFVPTETGNLLMMISDWISLGFSAIGGQQNWSERSPLDYL